MVIFFHIYIYPVSYPLPLLQDTNCWMKCVQHTIYSVEQTPFFEKVIKLKIKVLQIPLFNKKERFAWWTVPIYNLLNMLNAKNAKYKFWVTNHYENCVGFW